LGGKSGFQAGLYRSPQRIKNGDGDFLGQRRVIFASMALSSGLFLISFLGLYFWEEGGDGIIAEEQSSSSGWHIGREKGKGEKGIGYIRPFNCQYWDQRLWKKQRTWECIQCPFLNSEGSTARVLVFST